MDLTTLFKIILSLSFMGSILAVIIILIKGLFKNKFNGGWHYYIWFLLIIRLVMPHAPESSLSIFNFLNPPSPSIEIVQDDINRESTTVDISPTKNEATLDYMDVDNTADLNTKPVEINDISAPTQKGFEINYETLSIVWLIGVVMMLVYFLIINTRFLLRIKKQSQCKEEEIIRIFNECKSKMNVYSKVDVIDDKSAKTPSLFGFVKPKLLISSDILNDLSEEEKRYIFLHELSHYKRKDILVNWVMVLIQALHWFNPIIWYSFYKMREDCEVACDAYVLLHLKPADHKKYGETIINFIRLISKPYWIPVTTSMVSSKSGIKRRIKMITTFKKNAYRWSLVAISLLLLVGCVGLTDSKSKENVIEHSVAGKVVDIDKLLEYKDSYVGDSSAVGGILSKLPGSVFSRGFSLQTSSEPYGIEVNYELTDDQIVNRKALTDFFGYTEEFATTYGIREGTNIRFGEEDFIKYWNDDSAKKIFLNNATTFFILVKNVEEIRFNVNTTEQLTFSITRKELEAFYGKDLRTYSKDKPLWEKEVLEDTIYSDSRIESFFKTYDCLEVSPSVIDLDNNSNDSSNTNETGEQPQNRVTIVKDIGDILNIDVIFDKDTNHWAEVPEVSIKDGKMINDILSMIQVSLPVTDESKFKDMSGMASKDNKLVLAGKNGKVQDVYFTYDSLYEIGFIEVDGKRYEPDYSFFRYISELIEYTNPDTNVGYQEHQLFNKYNWTIDYRINTITKELPSNLRHKAGEYPVKIYWAYNYELSKSIGLDFSEYLGKKVQVEIYRLRESLPSFLEPREDARGIVVKHNNEIIGAFIDAGRHSSFACSLDRKSLKDITNMDWDQWIESYIDFDDELEIRLSKMTPEEVIREYFDALDKNDIEKVWACMTRKNLSSILSSNLDNRYLINNYQEIDYNINSAKLLEIKKFTGFENEPGILEYQVTVDFDFKKLITADDGVQPRFVIVKKESEKSGWRIAGIGTGP